MVEDERAGGGVQEDTTAAGTSLTQRMTINVLTLAS